MKLLNRYLNQQEQSENTKKSKLDNHNQHHFNYKPGNTPFEAYLRVRPLFLPEQMRNPQNSIEVLDRESVIFRHEHQQGLKSLTKDKLYRCSKTVPPGGKTNQLLQLGILDLAHDAFKGLNQAIFVIGGKDSGKTHTFIGNVGDPGLCFLIPNTIFQLKQKHYPDARIYLSCFSFQNNFKDLLAYTGESLEHRSTYNGAYLPGLSLNECQDMQTYLTFLKTALVVNGKRDINRDFSQAFTLFNCQPDKEIFIIKFTIINTVDGGKESDKKQATADLYIIDTESYESLDKIDSKGVNNAMLSFNNCMRTIYEINMKMREDNFVHYEQSPFTSYFKEYLGGKSKTFIIGTVSPYSGHLEYSMRTVREVQWAYKSKSNGVKHQEPTIGKQALAREVGYLKIMHNHSVLIAQEIAMYLKRKNLVEEEEKQKYIQFLGRIFKKLYYANKICHEKIIKILELRDQIIEICNQIIELEKSVMKEQLRSPDIKEFFLVKIVPLMYNLVYTKIQKAQHSLQKKIKLLKSENLTLVMLRKDVKDFNEYFLKKNKQINLNHQDAIYCFARTFLEHINWSQYNFFKSFNHPDKEKLLENKVRVEKTIIQNFQRIFTSLNITDQDKFEDRAFSYMGIRLIDLQQQEKQKTKNYIIVHKVPSLVNFSQRASFFSHSLHGTRNQIDEEGPISQTQNILKKQLSSVFDLPSSTMLIKSNVKTDPQRRKAKQNSKSFNSLEEKGSDDEDYSDEEYEFQIINQGTPIYQKRKYMKRISQKNSQQNIKNKRESTQAYLLGLLGTSQFEDDEQNELNQKSKHFENEPVHIPRLQLPTIDIQVSKNSIKILKKIQSQSSRTQSVNNSNQLNSSQIVPNQNNINFSQPTSEVNSNSYRHLNVAANILEVKNPDSVKKNNRLNKSYEDSRYHIKDQDETQSETITFGIQKKEKFEKDQIQENQNAQILHNQEKNQNYYDDDQHNNSLLNAISTQRNYNFLLDQSGECIYTNRSHQAIKDIHEKDRQISNLQIEDLYHNDIQLKSQFNDKIVVNVNLFKNDLENYKLPFSIRRIFNSNSVIRSQQNESQKKKIRQQSIQPNMDDFFSPSLPKIPPKNSFFNRQLEIANQNMQIQSSADIKNKRNLHKQNDDKMFSNKSIYYDSLQALIQNASSPFKRYSAVESVFNSNDNMIEDQTLLSTKQVNMKQKMLMKKQYYALRRKKEQPIFKPSNIQKVVNPTQTDLDQASEQTTS
ncbi:hypothetical protein ABPG72_010478 [Tetrahymena utriculariae]